MLFKISLPLSPSPNVYDLYFDHLTALDRISPQDPEVVKFLWGEDGISWWGMAQKPESTSGKRKSK